ncbi:hypothetical protein [Variovorax sp. JS1663]|uniref:hypothetical protein n=1 Tax=Variovorax sp. JS1663 TaxID=1851577 RepID=UPI000B3473F9|nr:hypothetical protein [Variovorax sp. JS1663]OUL99045.1 hypothetical protein A8M77_28385 [Variovorax sp. JS1663]
MFLIKTEKARQELQPGRRTLGQRERALLLMADGRRSVTDFGELFGSRDEAGRVALHLVQEGYLLDSQILRTAAPAPAAVPAPVAPPPEAHPAMPPPSVSADAFDGKRSLATTRMFLFDLCERMFVRRDPLLAGQFRETLREARDRGSMLSVAEAMVGEIEKLAGAERAASIRERILRLLPVEETVH